jgi:hypothetical protein
MKRLFLLLVIVGGALAVVRRLPALMGGMMEHMPDD